MTTTVRAEEMPDHMLRVAVRLETVSFKPVLEDCRDELAQDVRDNFTSSATPEGKTWDQRKVLGDGHPLLMDTGALIQAATGGGAGHFEWISDRVFQFGVDVTRIVYAAVHQYGWPARHIPARRYLGMKRETKLRCRNKIAAFVRRTVFGG